jgi:hypothetical protein
MEYEFPSRLVDLVLASGLPASSPMVLVEEAVGWAAPRGAGLHGTVFVRGGERVTKMSVVLGFDEDSWEPGNYPQWLESQRADAQAFYRRAREAQIKKLTGGAEPVDRATYRDAG